MNTQPAHQTKLIESHLHVVVGREVGYRPAFGRSRRGYVGDGGTRDSAHSAIGHL